MFPDINKQQNITQFIFLTIIFDILLSIRNMGSRITRALGVTDRSRRVSPENQTQVKQLIRIMCSSMFAFLTFGIGFLTQHSNETHQSCYQFLAIATMFAFIVNATNQQICLIFGWFLVGVQVMFLKQNLKMMFATGSFFVIMAISINLYNYFGNGQSNKQKHVFFRNIKPSSLVLLGSCILYISHCCSHFSRLLRAQANGTSIQTPHHVGIKFIFVFMGIMIVALTFLGHVYIRNRRFVSLRFSEQIKYLTSIKSIKLIQIIALLISLRTCMLQTFNILQCKSGTYSFLILLYSILIIFSFIIFFQKLLPKSSSSQIPNILTMFIILCNLVASIFKISFYIHYPISLLSCLLLITICTNLIQNSLRVSYVIVYIVAIIMQANSKQHVYAQNQDSTVFTNLWIGCLFAGIGIFLQTVIDYIKNKTIYRQINENADNNVHSIENISI